MNLKGIKNLLAFSGSFLLITALTIFLLGMNACIEPGPDKCPYQSDTDLVTITTMIKAEAEAANNENMSVIRAIFAPKAHIVNERDGTEWNDAVSHYKELFRDYDFTGAKNFDIKTFGKGITEDTAYFSSSNSGVYIKTGEDPVEYNNTELKDTWIFKKNADGCWVITEYRYY